MSKQKINFDDIANAAKREQWEFVDANFEIFLTKDRFEWALMVLRKNPDQNRNTRDLAATILNRTTFKFTPDEQAVLIAHMLDTAEYHIVRYRIAVALYQRNIRPPEVLQMMEEARKDSDVGDLAQEALSKAL